MFSNFVISARALKEVESLLSGHVGNVLRYFDSGTQPVNNDNISALVLKKNPSDNAEIQLPKDLYAPKEVESHKIKKYKTTKSKRFKSNWQMTIVSFSICVF